MNKLSITSGRKVYCFSIASNSQSLLELKVILSGDKPDNKMESFFLAETMKYAYLLQDPDTEIDLLRKHIFSTEAHPLSL